MKVQSRIRAGWAIALGMLLAPQAVWAADAFKVDGGHSNVIFRVKHMNAAFFYGRFNDMSGTFLVDANDPAQSSIDITVKADSVDAKMNKLNEHLKSADFFSVKEFPTITFKSKSFAKGDEGKLKVTGDLTLHGVTKEITVDIEPTGPVSGPRGEGAGFEAFFSIKRSDYGMNFMPDQLGDDVRLIVSIEGRR